MQINVNKSLRKKMCKYKHEKDTETTEKNEKKCTIQYYNKEN